MRMEGRERGRNKQGKRVKKLEIERGQLGKERKRRRRRTRKRGKGRGTER